MVLASEEHVRSCLLLVTRFEPGHCAFCWLRYYISVSSPPVLSPGEGQSTYLSECRPRICYIENTSQPSFNLRLHDILAPKTTSGASVHHCSLSQLPAAACEASHLAAILSNGDKAWGVRFQVFSRYSGCTVRTRRAVVSHVSLARFLHRTTQQSGRHEASHLPVPVPLDVYALNLMSAVCNSGTASRAM